MNLFSLLLLFLVISINKIVPFFLAFRPRSWNWEGPSLGDVTMPWALSAVQGLEMCDFIQGNGTLRHFKRGLIKTDTQRSHTLIQRADWHYLEKRTILKSVN